MVVVTLLSSATNTATVTGVTNTATVTGVTATVTGVVVPGVAIALFVIASGRMVQWLATGPGALMVQLSAAVGSGGRGDVVMEGACSRAQAAPTTSPELTASLTHANTNGASLVTSARQTTVVDATQSVCVPEVDSLWVWVCLVSTAGTSGPEGSVAGWMLRWL